MKKILIAMIAMLLVGLMVRAEAAVSDIGGFSYNSRNTTRIQSLSGGDDQTQETQALPTQEGFINTNETASDETSQSELIGEFATDFLTFPYHPTSYDPSANYIPVYAPGKGDCLKYNWHDDYSFEEIDIEELPENLPKSIEPQEGRYYYRTTQTATANYYNFDDYDSSTRTFAHVDFSEETEKVSYCEIYLDENNNMIINSWSEGGSSVEERIYNRPGSDLPSPWTGMANIPKRAIEEKYVVGDWVKVEDDHSFIKDKAKANINTLSDQIEALCNFRLSQEVYEVGQMFNVLGSQPAWVTEREGFLELDTKIQSWLDGEIQWQEVKDFIFSDNLKNGAPRVSEFAQSYYGILAGDSFDFNNLKHRNLVEGYMVFYVWPAVKRCLPDIASGVYESELVLSGPLAENQREELEEKDFWILEEYGNEEDGYRVIVQNTAFSWTYWLEDNATPSYASCMRDGKEYKVPLSFILDTVSRELSR